MIDNCTIIISFTTVVIAVVIPFLYMNRKFRNINESMRKELKSTNESLRRELRGINEYMSNKSNKNPETLGENSGKLSDLNKKLNDLKQTNEDQHAIIGHKIEKLEQIVSENLRTPEEPKPNNDHDGGPDKLSSTDQGEDGNPDQNSQSDQKQEEKIWVQKTAERLKKLEVSNTRKDMYLLKSGDDFLLNLVDLTPPSYVNNMNLYDSIISFPTGVKTINKVTMSKNPKYSKHGDFFHFEVRGEITVN